MQVTAFDRYIPLSKVKVPCAFLNLDGLGILATSRQP